MKLKVYGIDVDMSMLMKLLECVPEGTEECLVQAPMRRAMDLKACQRPGVLEYVASCDNKIFVHLSQPLNQPPTIKIL